MFPFTFFSMSTPMITTPMRQRREVTTCISTRSNTPFLACAKGTSETVVAGDGCKIFALIRAIINMNKPIPADTPVLSDIGIELNIASRTLVRESKIKMIPSTNTAARANCQDAPIPNTTV